MEMPVGLRQAIEELSAGRDQAAWQELSAELSRRYRSESGRGARLVTRAEEAAVYSAARMPATFAAAAAALRQALALCDALPSTLLDAGAGTGAASWAAAQILPLRKIVCLEREEAMRAVGARLMRGADGPLREAEWIEGDLSRGEELPRAELVTAAYVCNELDEGRRADAVDRLWRAAERMLVIVEPGTPEGFRQIRAARKRLLAQGAHIAAPCPQEGPCPVSGGDWCHFTCRVARSRLHKALKAGDVPYEDEKYAFLAVTREPCERPGTRVLRRLAVGKGHVELYVCRADGCVGAMTASKKDGELYKAARKASSGDALR